MAFALCFGVLSEVTGTPLTQALNFCTLTTLSQQEAAMLDAFIIDRLRREREEHARQDRVLRLPLSDQVPPRPKEEENEPQGPKIVDFRL